MVAFALPNIGWAQSPQRPSPQATTGPKPAAITPPSSAEVEVAIDRGLAFLRDDQNRNGSWGTAQNTKDLNIYAPVPGAHLAFRAAVTSLCYSAFVESGTTQPDDLKAIERAETWLLEYLPRVRRATPDAIYNVWAHAYGIQALVDMRRRNQDDAPLVKRIDEAIAQQIDLLTRYELVDGGWGYYDFVAQTKKPSGSSSSFTTATVLIALHEARDVGAEVPDRILARGVAAIRRMRKPDFSYAYGEYLKMTPMRSINLPGGSLGRSQACNIALRISGDPLVTDDVITTWLDRLWARNGWLSIGRKRPVPHESHFGVAGYFYYYGHYYAAMCIDALPKAERPYFQDHLAHTLIPLQEKDGCWWDYPLYNYHRQYGTAMAISSLVRCRKMAASESP